MEIFDHIDALDRDGTLLADAASAAGLRADVPGCPGWQVRDLLRHQAYVHRWAARHVAERAPEVIDDGLTESDILAAAPSDDDLIAAYRDGHAALVATLRDADPDVSCAMFMPAPSPLAFWARRQAHETAVHRYDAQSAEPSGAPVPGAGFDPAFAADGVDELIMCFAARRKYSPDDNGGGAEPTLAVRATDADARWHVRFGGGGTTVSRDDQAADAVVEGTAAGLYAFLWNRCDAATAGLAISGQPEALALWQASVRVRW